jgi:Flp pilus assembly protein CpaB
MHDLSEWTDPKNYKTYDELKTKLNSILGMSAPQTVAAAVSLDEVARPVEPAAVLNPHIPQEPVTAEQVSEEGEEDTMSYFARLANTD